MRIVRARLALLGLATALQTPMPAAAMDGPQPYQMVRSLQQVQDRIADGDTAALPMQRKILELADAKFRGMDAAAFDDPLNRRALLLYAMSGGNPATVELALSRLGKDEPDRRLGDAILLYIQGQPKAAASAFDRIEPMIYKSELAAYLALVKGAVLATDQPDAAIKALDQARLLSPGTLIEEAALRRSVSVAATLNDDRRFLRSAYRYAQAFIHSPYASQFADGFVAGVIALHGKVSLAAVREVIDLMDAERQHVIYLRIARKAAIDGLEDLSAFASAAAEGKVGDDPRAQLYSGLSSVTSESIEDVSAKLAEVDRKQLSANDRRLLDAARAVAAGVTAAPRSPEAKQSAVTRAVGERPGTMEVGPSASVKGAVAGPVEVTREDTPPVASAPASPPEPPNAADATMVAARRKLDDIDRLLETAAP